MSGGERGSKRTMTNMVYETFTPAVHRSTLLSVPAGAAVYENAVSSRFVSDNKKVNSEVQEYYSKVLTKSSDLKTSCCTTAGAPPIFLRKLLSNIHDAVMSKYYGCGFVAPDLLQGMSVLDLGCGAGRDCYLLAQLVGQTGRVVGVDMSQEQLATARDTIEWHRKRFGFSESNVSFVCDRLETLLDARQVISSGTCTSSEGGSLPEIKIGNTAGITAVYESAVPLPVDVPSKRVKTGGESEHAIVVEREKSNYEALSIEEGGGIEDRAFFSAAGRLAANESDILALHNSFKSAREILNVSDLNYDVIVSNCVINLSPDKATVLDNAFRLLKPGGELYFSDVYCTQRVPLSLRKDPVLWGECLSGALYWNDFLRLAKECGFGDPRLVCSSPIAIQNETLEEKIFQAMPNASPGKPLFYSATYRLFKIAELEPDCENYGQAVKYLGTIPVPSDVSSADYADTVANPKFISTFELDDHHRFPTGMVVPVCGNTFRMLHQTRFKPHFQFIGEDFAQHFGIFDGCGKNMPFSSEGGGCC